MSGDAFLVTLPTDGSPGTFATFLGGASHEEGFAAAPTGVDDGLFVAGATHGSPNDFPTVDALWPAPGGSDGFFTKFAPARLSLPDVRVVLNEVPREDVAAGTSFEVDIAALPVI